MQGVLASLFLFAGVMKLVLPIEAMAGPVALPGLFLRFIGVCEALGAVGLILPGLLRIHQELTPVAAAGLVIIMVGADCDHDDGRLHRARARAIHRRRACRLGRVRPDADGSADDGVRSRR